MLGSSNVCSLEVSVSSDREVTWCVSVSLEGDGMRSGVLSVFRGDGFCWLPLF